LLKHQIQNVFTKQLRELTITGSDLELISSEAFSSIEGGELILRIKDTHVQRLQSDIFLPLTKRLSQLTLDLRNNHINELSPSIIYGNLSWETVGTNMVAGEPLVPSVSFNSRSCSFIKRLSHDKQSR